jgi:peptidoglycan hydrolase-like protein with peptidoglycan-binding domain
VANYGKNTGVKNSTIKLKKYDLHQYTSRGSIKGVSGNVDLSEVYTGVSESAEEVYNMKTIKKGSKGKAVKLWQIIVGTTPDGDFGAKTDKATRDFQKAKGLTVDGIVGKNSWKAGLESV